MEIAMTNYSIPKIKLLNASRETIEHFNPFADIVSSARTCYSAKGIVLPQQIESEDQLNENNDSRFLPLIQSLYQAGHHTTFQHSYLHFSMENVSRNAIWSFLHSHPFYNSEQVSQRYVHVKKDQFFYPEGLSQNQLSLLEECYENQIKDYKEYRKLTQPLVESEYLKRFKSRKGSKQAEKDIKKKGMEVARYLLPIGTTAYLHHTVSFITLLRYYRLCHIFDVPAEQRALVDGMMAEVIKIDPQLPKIIEDPLPFDASPEYQFMQEFCGQRDPHQFIKEFDNELDNKISLLIDYKVNQERTLANSIREVSGLTSQAKSDDTLIDWVLNSGSNRLLGESLNLGTHSKLMRSLLHSHYTFKKKLSHTADSQDQRHRMTPGSRPILQNHFTGNPDYITPLITKMDDKLVQFYDNSMAKSWDFVNKGLAMGMSFEQASYMLPNALSIRFTESADLLNLKHKMAMRLCYNAQEEIWQASLEEALQISEVHPKIGEHLLPPCNIRSQAKTRPICPEGPRFCGVPVWKIKRENYQRSI